MFVAVLILSCLAQAQAEDEECVDQLANCAAWASQFCTHANVGIEVFMKRKCPKSCSVCGDGAIQENADLAEGDIGDLTCGDVELGTNSVSVEYWSDKEAAKAGAITGINIWTNQDSSKYGDYTVSGMQVRYRDVWAARHPNSIQRDPDHVFEFGSDERLTSIEAWHEQNIGRIFLHTTLNEYNYSTYGDHGDLSVIDSGHEIIYFTGFFDTRGPGLAGIMASWDYCDVSTQKNAIQETISKAQSNLAVGGLFTQYKGQHISWGTPQDSSVTSVAACADLCLQDKNCSIFDFNYGYIDDKYVGPYQGVACWLHDASKSLEDMVDSFMRVDCFVVKKVEDEEEEN